MKTSIFIKILFLVLIFGANTLLAQVPKKISYQAVVRNSDNELLKNANISVKITIGYNLFFGIPPRPMFISVYSETHNVTTNENGLFTIEIGGGTTTFGKFDTIPWAKYTYLLKTEIDPTGGTNYTITSTTQILSVPYSLYSEKSTKSDTANFGKNGIIAYGNIKSDGTINISSNNFTCQRTSTGSYQIRWNTDSNINTYYNKSVVLITPLTFSVMPRYSSMDAGRILLIHFTNVENNPVDADFSFVVFNVN